MDRWFSAGYHHFIDPLLEFTKGKNNIFEMDILKGVPMKNKFAVVTERAPEVAAGKKDD
jgi:hypothetical protein